MRRQVGKVVNVQKTWLSSREAKEFLDCSDNFLKNLRDEAKVSFSIVRGKYYYELVSLERLIKINKVV